MQLKQNLQKLKRKKKKVDIKMKMLYNTIRPRDPIARDLKTPKYRMRKVESKVNYIRKPKHKKGDYEYQY